MLNYFFFLFITQFCLNLFLFFSSILISIVCLLKSKKNINVIIKFFFYFVSSFKICENSASSSCEIPTASIVEAKNPILFLSPTSMIENSSDDDESQYHSLPPDE